MPKNFDFSMMKFLELSRVFLRPIENQELDVNFRTLLWMGLLKHELSTYH
ncbi:hypothetical protein GCM10007111_31370 [Virgibacillus kapii]|uniref:Uncharacterized protein n=1 Tax=Virgibacillus kapii TaxID=1638645 RepID=A0ABQ2DPV3_9BACI|nr:hypothetical protein M948_00835 [Virgibacillus sp. CM-4]GGJ67175.1 hypothetical protein GCM10007111_31370 [Virgibacillus kapii]